MRLSLVPFPVLSWDLHGTMVTCQFIPVTPIPLFPTAPIVPAVWVPWPKSSSGSLSWLMVSIPWQSSTYPSPSSSTPGTPVHSGVLFHTFAARSTCTCGSICTPVSNNPTATVLLPVVRSHAFGPSTSSPGVPPICPVFCQSHWRLNEGSLGTVSSMCEMKLGSAYMTSGSCR